jgi:hypothetical protein
MILHSVDSNLSWVEALKDNTGGELFLAQARAMERMRKAGIVPKHQILDNQNSVAYKEAICRPQLPNVLKHELLGHLPCHPSQECSNCK